jgi:hypothetical protein
VNDRAVDPTAKSSLSGGYCALSWLAMPIAL